MRTMLQHIKFIIVNEVSMLSSSNLTYALKAEEVLDSGQWFGGINILFVGDILQLPPVNGAAVFQ